MTPERRLGAALRTEVTADHVGRRVTIRHLVDTDLGTRPTDVVGHLRAWGDVVVVERRDGAEVRVDPHRIVASRLVPDPPVRPSGRG